mgnify:CR=1 FL=1
MDLKHNKEDSIHPDIDSLDAELSKRFISLDPNGYFLIHVDHKAKELIVEHFTNEIDKKGTAIDPETGDPIPCSGGTKRTPLNVFKGKSAKEVGIRLTEGAGDKPVHLLDHALYLGRELQKAEQCMRKGVSYIQD